jgi:hypothetical protein
MEDIIQIIKIYKLPYMTNITFNLQLLFLLKNKLIVLKLIKHILILRELIKLFLNIYSY